MVRWITLLLGTMILSAAQACQTQTQTTGQTPKAATLTKTATKPNKQTPAPNPTLKPSKPAAPTREQVIKQLQPKLATVDKEFRKEVLRALLAADKNRPEIMKVLADAPREQQRSAAFLLTNMPNHDLKSLSAKFLLENISLAYKAWKSAPWTKQIGEQQYFQYILPYAHLNEQRDNWRGKLMKEFAPKAWQHKTPADAAKWLNTNVFKELKVTYHATKRRIPDQGPFESIKRGYASCTGLSILYADACRACGLPARIVGVPRWNTRKGGNHNWVEIWDNQWYAVGEIGSDPRDKNWVHGRAKNQTDNDKLPHRVYAATFRKNVPYFFPLVWNLNIRYVPAINITLLYQTPTTLPVTIPDKQTGEVKVYWQGELLSRAVGKGTLLLPVAAGQEYDVEIIVKGKSTRKKMKAK